MGRHPAYSEEADIGHLCIAKWVEYRECALPFTDPSGGGVPISSSLEPPEMFARTSFCLIQKLLDGGHGCPNRCIFLDKRGVLAVRDSFRRVLYGNQFKTCLTPVMQPNRTPSPKQKAIPKGTPAQPNKLRESPDAGFESELSYEFDDDVATELGGPSEYSDGERADDLGFWMDREEHCIFNPRNAQGSIQQDAMERAPAREIEELRGILSGIVDESKYYVVVNSLTCILTVRWENSGRALQWGRFTKSKTLVDAPDGEKITLKFE